MLFNQRPIVEHFAWGKDVNDLDFAGGQLFLLQHMYQRNMG